MLGRDTRNFPGGGGGNSTGWKIKIQKVLKLVFVFHFIHSPLKKSFWRPGPKFFDIIMISELSFKSFSNYCYLLNTCTCKL